MKLFQVENNYSVSDADVPGNVFIVSVKKKRKKQNEREKK